MKNNHSLPIFCLVPVLNNWIKESYYYSRFVKNYKIYCDEVIILFDHHRGYLGADLVFVSDRYPDHEMIHSICDLYYVGSHRENRVIPHRLRSNFLVKLNEVLKTIGKALESHAE